MASLLYAEIYLICILIVALILYWAGRSGSNSTGERRLRVMLWTFLINFISNLLFAVFNGLWDSFAPAKALCWGFKTVYHISLCVGVYAWCGYAEAQRSDSPFKNRTLRLLTLIPLAIPVMLALINLKTRWLFDIDAQGHYAWRNMYHFQMAYLVAGSALFSVPQLRRIPREFELSRRNHLALTASFPLCLLVAWIISNVGEGYPVKCVFIAFDLLLIYMDSATRQISQDKLTQVNNRQNLLSFMEYKIRNHDEPLFLLMMDVDYFKAINDTYGHLEGDEALIQVAKALKRACGAYHRRPYIARYGGDEFIILLEGSQAECDRLCGDIRTALKALCAEANKPYDLSLSIGVACWQTGMNPNDFIAAADARLYEIKRARPQRR